MAQDKIRYRVVEKREDLFEIEYKYPYVGEWTLYLYCKFKSLADARDAIAAWQRLETESLNGKVVWESE